MAKKDLVPFSSLTVTDHFQGMTLNFQRIDLLSEIEKDVVSEIITVTGTITYTTALSSAEGVVAVLATPPVAGACFVSTSVVASSGTIIVNVWSNAFAASVIATPIQYVAVGVMNL